MKLLELYLLESDQFFVFKKWIENHGYSLEDFGINED